jgi:hypothetical protein
MIGPVKNGYKSRLLVYTRTNQLNYKKPMDSLPALCIDLIADYLVHHLNNVVIENQESVSAKCAANFMCVGSQTFTHIGKHIYNKCVDRGCVDAVLETQKAFQQRKVDAQEEITKNTHTLSSIRDIIEKECNTTTKVTLADLKAMCKSANCPVSGSKSKLIENLQAAKERIENRNTLFHELLQKTLPNKTFKCPVREMGRELCIAQAHPSKITLTTAKSTYKLKEGDLDTIECEERRNPHYRRGPTMRLYILADVIRVAIKKHGMASLDADADAECLECDPIQNAEAIEKATKAMLREEGRTRKLQEHLDAVNLTINDMNDLNDNIIHKYIKGNLSEATLQEEIGNTIGRKTRRDLLIADLAAVGLTLRNDSKLCEQYIEYGHKFNQNEVTHRHYIVGIMREMAFYYNETAYVEIAETIAEEKIRDERDISGYLSREDYAELHQEAREEAKDKALYRWACKWTTFADAASRDELPPTLKQTILAFGNRGKSHSQSQRQNKNKKIHCPVCNDQRVFVHEMALEQHRQHKHPSHPVFSLQ